MKDGLGQEYCMAPALGPAKTTGQFIKIVIRALKGRIRSSTLKME